MADFKIKPASGTGNKLILQTEDATDVLTTSDSGVTLASATLNSPTLVTPALGTPASGVATNITGIPAANLTGTITSGTQDAITRLGTVTSSGTINGQTLSDSGWVSLNSYLQNSWADYNTDLACKYRAVGDIAMIVGIVRYGSGSIMTVPSAIRPARETYFPFPGLSDSFGASTNDMYMSLSPNGVLHSVVVGTAWTSIGITYITG